ncbi:MAG: hypothetical protein J7J98_03230 [candidate division Zixibacteria bacterium]|nr:hypothetical protein [candidate division Zixibacteria bacterium]
MMENTQSKGMSKGCLIGLIVGGILVVIIAIGLTTCWIYKDDLVKMGGATLVNGLKAELATNEYESVDTVQFNAIADAFLQAQDQDTLFDLEGYMLFMQSLQGVMSNKVFDEDEIPVIIDAFIEYYPELEELRPITVEEEETTEIDSVFETTE